MRISKIFNAKTIKAGSITKGECIFVNSRGHAEYIAPGCAYFDYLHSGTKLTLKDKKENYITYVDAINNATRNKYHLEFKCIQSRLNQLEINC